MPTENKKFAAVYCVYHDDIWLPRSVESIYSSVDAIIFLVSSSPWNGPKTDNSSTLELINNLKDPDNKIRLIQGDWLDQVTQRNYGLELVRDEGFDFQLIIDADELYDRQALERALGMIARDPLTDVWHINWVTYWKSPLYRIDPPEPYNPPICIRTRAVVRFIEYRNARGSAHKVIPPEVCYLHHLSYARPDWLIKRKINSISAAPLIAPTWFENVWLAWDHNHSLQNLHPVKPRIYQRAVFIDPQYLPHALHDTISKYLLPLQHLVEREVYPDETRTFYQKLYSAEFPKVTLPLVDSMK